MQRPISILQLLSNRPHFSCRDFLTIDFCDRHYASSSACGKQFVSRAGRFWGKCTLYDIVAKLFSNFYCGLASDPFKNTFSRCCENFIFYSKYIEPRTFRDISFSVHNSNGFTTPVVSFKLPRAVQC